jgi:hypothetical protein
VSNNELAYFYILDWSDKVTDIREQYPLSDLDCAVNIAAEAGIKYPVDNISGYPYVLTCDFMITTVNGMKARTIKMASELQSVRILEKLEIERRYWLAQGVDWKIVTEREIPYRKAKNIEWLCTAYGNIDEPYELLQAQDMMLQIIDNSEYSILEAAQIIEREFLLDGGKGLQLFKHLVLNRKLAINMNEPINLNMKGAVVRI